MSQFILVAEDDKDISNLVSTILEEAGYSVEPLSRSGIRCSEVASRGGLLVRA